MSTSVDFYCLNYKNESRRKRMLDMFTTAGITCTIYEGVGPDDERMNGAKDSRVWSCMWGHLDMIRKFVLESKQPFGIFCEDDVRLNKSLVGNIPELIKVYKHLNLSVMLLGYMNPDTSPDVEQFPEQVLPFETTLKYHNYPNNLWGAQMYFLDKSSGRRLLETYGNGQFARHSKVPFSSDWLITKPVFRALVFPPQAVEEFTDDSNSDAQTTFHRQCYLRSYNSDDFY